MFKIIYQMKLSDYISKDIQAFSPQTTVLEAKQLFNETTLSHFPIIENDTFLAMISESDIRAIDNDDKELSQLSYLFDNFYVTPEQNWMEILKILASNEANILPVINKDYHYNGYYELSDILHFFNESPLIREEGFFLIIEKGVKDYSISEVVQIVESAAAKLIGVFISGYKNDLVQITLKVYSENINEIIQSFRRYGYNLVSKHKEDLLLEELKDRSEYLQKYLNI